MALKGIDVSKHQGVVDWAKVKASGKVDFAMIRAGYGRYTSQIDARFIANITAAAAAGIPVGVYWYSYASSAADAKKEAETCLSVIAPYKDKITLPVFFDQEYEQDILAASKTVRTACCKAFCDAVRAAGYQPGLYASTDWLTDKITVSSVGDVTIWVAQYASKCTYKGKYTIWQYTSDGSVSGISGRVDLNQADDDLLPKASNADGWKKDAKGWTYGGYRSKWLKSKDYWYWFDKDGYAVTGWVEVKNVWYYFLTAEDAKKSGYPECACMSIDKSK